MSDGVVLVNGSPAGPGPGVPLDDPLVRAGDGLIETMRARGGVVRFRDRHLGRLARSAAALGYAKVDAAVVEADVEAALAASGDGDLRVRVCVSASGWRWVEAVPCPPPSPAPAPVAAVTVPGAWMPGWWMAEHKTASRAHIAHAGRQVRSAGVATALLLDGSGRLGEALYAAVFAVVDGEVLTAQVRGILPGVGRAVLLEAMPEVVERAPMREEWARAGEVFTVSAFAGVEAVTSIDGVDVGQGTPGQVARRAAGLWHAAS